MHFGCGSLSTYSVLLTGLAIILVTNANARYEFPPTVLKRVHQEFEVTKPRSGWSMKGALAAPAGAVRDLLGSRRSPLVKPKRWTQLCRLGREDTARDDEDCKWSRRKNCASRSHVSAGFASLCSTHPTIARFVLQTHLGFAQPSLRLRRPKGGHHGLQVASKVRLALPANRAQKPRLLSTAHQRPKALNTVQSSAALCFLMGIARDGSSTRSARLR